VGAKSKGRRAETNFLSVRGWIRKERTIEARDSRKLSESPTRETRMLPGLHRNTSVVSPAAETLITDHSHRGAAGRGGGLGRGLGVACGRAVGVGLTVGVGVAVGVGVDGW
jgi:hypothetical protein